MAINTEIDKILKEFVHHIGDINDLVGETDPKKIEKALDEVYLYCSDKIEKSRKRLFKEYQIIQHFSKIINELQKEENKNALKKIRILTKYKKCNKCRRYFPESSFTKQLLNCIVCSKKRMKKSKHKSFKDIQTPKFLIKMTEVFIAGVKSGEYDSCDYRKVGALAVKKDGIKVKRTVDTIILNFYTGNSIMELDITELSVLDITNFFQLHNVELVLT